MASQLNESLARTFIKTLGRPDKSIFGRLATPDVVWSFPGASLISGEAHGVDGVMERAATIAAYGVKMEIVRATTGYDTIALILHNTGAKSGRDLDEHVTAVFSFADGKISRLDTHLSDVAMAEAFFG